MAHKFYISIILKEHLSSNEPVLFRGFNRRTTLVPLLYTSWRKSKTLRGDFSVMLYIEWIELGQNPTAAEFFLSTYHPSGRLTRALQRYWHRAFPPLPRIGITIVRGTIEHVRHGEHWPHQFYNCTSKLLIYIPLWTKHLIKPWNHSTHRQRS